MFFKKKIICINLTLTQNMKSKFCSNPTIIIWAQPSLLINCISLIEASKSLESSAYFLRRQ